MKQLLPAILACLALPAQAQYLNRAIWLGSDVEDIRRDYEQGKEYFMDRWATVSPGPWHRPNLDPFVNRLYAAGGSVSSKRATVEANGNLGIELGRGFDARLAYLQSENQATQFLRVGVGLEKSLGETAAGFLLLEGTPDKSRADLSLGAEFLRSDHGAHRLTLTAVDFSSGKSEDFEYDEDPYGILLAGYRNGDRWQWRYELDAQLPFQEREIETGDVLHMHRVIAGLEARLMLTPSDRLIFSLDGERSSKSLRTADPAAVAREDYDGELYAGGIEWWRSLDGGRELTVGISATRLRNTGDRPNAPDQALAESRDELMLFARGHIQLNDAWSIEPYVIGGDVDYDAGLPDQDDRFSGFQGRIGSPLLFAFSERAWIRFDLAMQLDSFGFAGGAVQFQADF